MVKIGRKQVENGDKVWRMYSEKLLYSEQ